MSTDWTPDPSSWVSISTASFPTFMTSLITDILEEGLELSIWIEISLENKSVTHYESEMYFRYRESSWIGHFVQSPCIQQQKTKIIRTSTDKSLRSLSHCSRILKTLPKLFKIIIFNPFQSSPSSAILVPFCSRITPLMFSFLRKPLFVSFATL